MSHDAEAIRAQVEDGLGRHGRAICGFSGGKESLVLWHALRPLRDRVTFAWVNTGAMLPHMRPFVLKHDGVIELHGNLPLRFKTAGLPAMMVPIRNTDMGALAEREPKGRIRINDWFTCCVTVRCQPLIDHARAHGIPLLIHGQRHQDNVTPFSNMPGGLEEIGPLWDWTEAEVYAYIEANGIELPHQYANGNRGSFECWACTALIDPDRVRYLSKHYPELWAMLRPNVLAVAEAIYHEVERLDQVIETMG
jgi:3'-phosphoadenosine 5'-phosphosulfate sulfotransferase (PAPS reductase)/FAD synthetase